MLLRDKTSVCSNTHTKHTIHMVSKMLAFYNKSSAAYSNTPIPVAERSSAVHLLELWVQIPPVAWMSVSCECCMLSASGWSPVRRSPTERVVCLSVIVKPRQ
jgi:hypothetical protein